jgi:hypothetical protein
MNTYLIKHYVSPLMWSKEFKSVSLEFLLKRKEVKEMNIKGIYLKLK